MTTGQTILVGVAVLFGLEYLMRRTSPAGAVPWTGAVHYPGAASGTVTDNPPVPVAPDPFAAGTYTISGTGGSSAAELAALGFTPDQVTAIALSGDPAIGAILDVNPTVPIPPAGAMLSDFYKPDGQSYGPPQRLTFEY